jgi:hypothetical protein
MRISRGPIELDAEVRITGVFSEMEMNFFGQEW